MRDEARRVLVLLVKEYGPAVADHPDRLRGLFLDYAPWHVRVDGMSYIHAVTKAAEAGFIPRMLAYQRPGQNETPDTPKEFIRRLSLELQQIQGGDESQADWACEAWGVALGLIDEPPPEAIVIIPHDPLPMNFPAAPPEPPQYPLPSPRSLPSTPAATSAPPSPPVPPPLNAPITPAPAPLPPSVAAPAFRPPPPRAALDWITPRLIDASFGSATLVAALSVIDGGAFYLTRAFPAIASFGPLALPWLLAVFAVWYYCAKLANLPNDRETNGLLISGITLITLGHWFLWHVFETSFPGYQVLWMAGLHILTGLVVIIVRHHHTEKNKLIEYTLVTLGTLLLGTAQLDVGSTLVYHCPLWAAFLTGCWAWPFYLLFKRSVEPTKSVLTLWTAFWLAAAFFGQWVLFYHLERKAPGWEVWVLTGLHLFAGWIMVWLVPLRRPRLRHLVPVLAAVICAAILAILGHALFLKTS